MPADPPADPSPIRDPGGSRVRRGRLVAATLVLVTLWVGAVAVSAVLARGQLTDARAALDAGREAVADGELELATAELDRAGDQLRRARRHLGGPHTRLAAAIPVAGNTLETARAVAEAAGTVTDAADDLLTTLEAARSQALDTPDGRVPVGAIGAVVDPVRRLADAVRAAHAELDASPTDAVVGAVREARGELLALLAPMVDDAQHAAAVVAALPGVLGADGPRTYLFGVSNPAEQRGTGGYIGAYTTLRIDDGELEFGAFEEVSELENLASGAFEVPEASVYARFGRFGWPFHWQSANLSPDFPTAAVTLERLWDASFGTELDGTIVADPFAYAQLVELTGEPLALPDGEQLPAGEVVDYLTNRSFLELPDPAQRKAVLGEIATGVLGRFLGSLGDGDLIASTRALTDLVRERHLLVHVTDPQAQAAFAALRIDGALRDLPGDDVAVVVNSGSPTKIDYWLARHVRYDVTLVSGGGASGQLSVELVNGAPADAPPSVLVGTGAGDLAVAENRSLVSLYCGPGCALTSTPAPVGPGELPRFEPAVELGHTTHSAWIQLPAGDRAVATWGVQTPDAWSSESGELVYRLHLRHQVSVAETSVEVRVAVPDGFDVASLPPGADLDAGEVVWRHDDVDADLELELRLVPRT